MQKADELKEKANTSLGFLHVVDATNERVGKIISWLFIPLTLIVTAEVVARYVFNNPSIWAWDVNIFILGITTILAGGFALLHGSHVSVDIMVSRFSPKVRAIIELVTYLFFFLGIAVMLWQSAEGAWDSMLVREKRVSFFAPPFYPFKFVIVVGIVLILFQGIAKFVRNIAIVAGRHGGEKE